MVPAGRRDGDVLVLVAAGAGEPGELLLLQGLGPLALLLCVLRYINQAS